MAQFCLGLTYAAAGKHEQALVAIERMDPDRAFLTLSPCAGSFSAQSGRRGAAEDSMRALKRIGSGGYAIPTHEAVSSILFPSFGTR